MIEIKSLAHYNERHHVRRNIDICNETLVVVDLHTKLEVQRDFLNQQPLLEENAVLRAHELWVKILVKTQPDIRVVSPILARSLIREWLERDDVSWARTESAASNVFRYIQQLLPVLCSPSSHEIMKLWFDTHSSAFIRWGNWFNLALQYWGQFQSLKLIPNPWVSAYLTSTYQGQKIWDRKLVLDLGCDLTPVESDLLQQMQNNHKIEIIKPSPSWASKYLGSQLGYHFLELKSLDEKKLDGIASFKPHVKFLRFSTMVSEVKAVTAKVRQWLDSGAQLSEIAVLAPSIETYWTVLRMYLEQEGVPVDKPIVTPLISKIEVSRWLSVLRLKSGKTTYEDLEMAEFTGSMEPKDNFETFRRIFQNIYGHEDLKRLQRIDREFSYHLNGSDILQRDEFVASSLHFWKSKNVESLQKLFDCLFQDSPPSLRLKLSQWIMYVEELCARVEIKTFETSHGIKFTNIQSGPHFESKYIYLLGLSESALKSPDGTSIELDEVLNIRRDTGYIIDFPDNKKNEFEARWILEGNFKEAIVSFSSSDFSGSVEGPAGLWLQGAISAGLDPEMIQYPEVSRWDEIQLNSIDDLKSVGDDGTHGDITHGDDGTHGDITHGDDGTHGDITHGDDGTHGGITHGDDGIHGGITHGDDGIHGDITHLKVGTTMEDRWIIKPHEKPTLSVTQLENYSKCPFIFAAHKLFYLSDRPNVDMDVDSMTKGRWMHRIFKELTKDPFRRNYKDSELLEIIESCREPGDWVDDKTWKIIRPGLLDMAQRFIVSEVELRKRFPKLCTKGREVSIEADWNLKSEGLTTKGSGDYLFKGSIDRVDTNGGNEASVVDYKSSIGNLLNFKSWINKNSFQLTVYSQAIEKGLTELGPHEVCSAFYYVSKDMSREKGFRMKDRGGDLFEAIGPTSATSSEIQSVQSQVMSSVQAIVERIDEGDFEPRPKDEKDCNSCHWRKICRAPHLN